MRDTGISKYQTELPAGYQALTSGAAVAELTQTVLRLTGKDPVGMLNAILTNDVPEGPGRGVYALLLNPKGRVQTDLRVLKGDEDDILVLTEPEGAEAAKEILGRYAPFSRVKLEETPWTVLGLYGPLAGSLLDGLELAEHETTTVDPAGTSLLVAGVARPVPGYDLVGPTESLREAREHLVSRGAALASPQDYEAARLKAGVPRFGPDITPDNFPAEAGILDRAVSFQKGCYPGQETVARMHYRGHPNRRLQRLIVEGPPPPSGTPILQGDKQVGTLTSVASLAVDREVLALGYLHRTADPNSPLLAGEETSVSPLAD